MASSKPNDDYVQKLQDELRMEKARTQAILEEFRNDLNDPTKEFSPEDLKKRFRVLLGTAWEQMNNLLVTADSESVRWQVSKFVLSVGLGQTKITDENDPDKDFKELLEALSNKEQG